MPPKQPLNVGNCFRRPAAPTPFEQPERLCSLRSSPAAFNIVMKTVQIKNITVGEGAPKIIVSLMAKDLAAVKSEAAAYAAADFDILEWRGDHFAAVTDSAAVLEALKTLRAAFPNKPILFTFRSKHEGGEAELTDDDYIALNIAVAETGLVDLIDLELFTGDELVKNAIAAAHARGVKVIMSNHDFHKTPAKDEIIYRLRRMQELGADIPKIALMPTCRQDVLTVLSATVDMAEKYADRPIITMSMGKTGVTSRLTGEAFGSAATFGAVKTASAPGQISVADLRTVLTIINKA